MLNLLCKKSAFFTFPHLTVFKEMSFFVSFFKVWTILKKKKTFINTVNLSIDEILLLFIIFSKLIFTVCV